MPNFSSNTDHSTEENAAEAARNDYWELQFIEDASTNGVHITVNTFQQDNVSLEDALEMINELATINRLNFVVETDLKALTSHDITRLTQMFQAMTSSRILLTFHLLVDGLTHKLPVGAIPTAPDVEVYSYDGANLTLILEYWFNKKDKPLRTLKLRWVSWGSLVGCDDILFDSLEIDTHSEDEFYEYLRLLILIDCHEFGFYLYDTNADKLLAEWTNIEHSLTVTLLSTEHADCLEKFLLLRESQDFKDINIMMEKKYNIFFKTCKLLWFVLQRYERYNMREIIVTVDDNSKRRSVKRVNYIIVNGTIMKAKLSASQVIDLPVGERFTSIHLDINGPKAIEYGQWLALCVMVEVLHVVDRGAGIVSYAMELATRNKLNSKCERVELVFFFIIVALLAEIFMENLLIF